MARKISKINRSTILRKLNQSMCKHTYKVFANITIESKTYGDITKTLLVCPKCGKKCLLHSYVEAPIDFNKLLDYAHYLNIGADSSCDYLQKLRLEVVKNNPANLSIFDD